jgi:hypothetical protein
VAAWRDCWFVGGADEVGCIAAEESMKSAIATLIAGIGCTGFSLFGYFDAYTSYCSPATNPCTPVVVSGSKYPKNAKFVKLHQGWGLLRTTSGVIAAISFGAAYFASSAASVKQRKVDELIAVDESRQKQLETTTSEILDEEEIQKTAIAADLRVKDFKRELYDGYNTLYLEKNPELLEALTTAATPQSLPAPMESNSQEIENAELLSNTASAANSNQLLGVELPITPKLGVKFFDWKQFRETPEMFPHIRGVAPTNGGKTTLFDWLMDVMPSDKKLVITIKRKPHQWTGLEVIGVPEDYDAIRSALESLQSERIRRTALMAKGIDSPIWNVGIDEWRVISKNIKAIVDRKTKQIVSPSAKQIMGDMITLARELGIRIFALAQGRQVVTWGLEDESDLAECFCSIYMGRFALEECEKYRNKYPKDSEEYAKYQQVRDYLESLGNRAAWISCELGESPAIVPDLSGWKREIPYLEKADRSPTSEPAPPSESDADRLNRTLDLPVPWDYLLAESTPEMLERLIELRKLQQTDNCSGNRDKLQDKPNGELSNTDNLIDGAINAESMLHKDYPPIWDAGIFASMLPDKQEKELFNEIKAYLNKSDKWPNASEIIQKVLKFTKPENHPRSYSKVGKPCFKYLIRKYGDASTIKHFAEYLDKE